MYLNLILNERTLLNYEVDYSIILSFLSNKISHIEVFFIGKSLGLKLTIFRLKYIKIYAP